MTPSPLLNADVTPTDPAQVWDLSRLFLMSWVEGFELESKWDTDILPSRTAAEKRWGFSSKPARTVRLTLYAFNPREAWMLTNLLKRMSMCRSIMPLYCDSMQLLAASGARLYGDPSDRRFYAGGRVVIGRRKVTCAGFGPECDTFETALIDSVDSGGITLTAATSNTFRQGDVVWPCMELDVGVQGPVTPWSGSKMTATVLASEVAGPSALPAWPDGLAGFDLHEGRPVFEVDTFYDHPEGTAAVWQRATRGQHTGLGDTWELDGPRSRMGRTYQFQPYNRQTSVRILKFFDALSGPLETFVGVSPLRPFEVVSRTSTTVTVKAAGPVSDWRDYVKLAVRVAGVHTPTVRNIVSVNRAGLLDTVTLDGTIDATTYLGYVTVAALMRFDGTNLKERWTTTQHCELQLSAVELLNEKDVQLL